MGSCQNALTANKQCMHSDRCENNLINITTKVIRDKAGKETGIAISPVTPFNDDNDFATNIEEPMPAPAVLMAGKKKKSKVVVQANEAGESNLMPPVVLAEVGDTSSSMIRTGEDDALDRMRKCQPEQEGNPMPSCVSVDKKDEK